jgi:hypothetical protein
MTTNSSKPIDISVSMILEKESAISQRESTNHIATLSFDNGMNRSWVDDRAITNCSQCNALFTLFIRKHHCRSCGQIFCDECASKYIKIPDDYTCHYQKENVFDVRSYYRRWVLQTEESRVCGTCYRLINEHNELEKMVSFFELLPLTIADWYRMKLVCRTWNKIAKIQLSRIRMILYKSIHIQPTRKTNELRRISTLLVNMGDIIGHSHWCLQFILHMRWNDPFVSEEEKKRWFDQIICNKTRITTCRKMMCRRSCSNELSNEDLFFILQSKITYYPLIQYVINTWTERLSETEFVCFLPSILMCMLFYSQFEDIRNDLEVFILRRAIQTTEIAHSLFWILTHTLGGSKIWYVGGHQWVASLRQKLVEMLDKESCYKLQYGYDLTNNLIQIALANPNNRIYFLREFLMQHVSNPQPFTLPVNSSRLIYRIDIPRIHILESKTEPIVIPCICSPSSEPSITNEERYTILLKKEDVRREEMMMRMLRLFDYYLKTEENLNLYIKTYPILPISDQYGYIEFIPNSYTLYSIREQYKFSIQNFILEKNPGLSISEFRDRFTKSCAAYCVFTYFMGIGDRHLDNIMITEDGTLFHIDYAYILGYDPKPIHAYSRLTPEMVDAMGGMSSANYRQFCTYCEIGIQCIRRHQNMFHSLLQYGSMVDPHLTTDMIAQFISFRFMPNQTNQEVYRFFMKMLEDTNETYGIHFMDFLHKQYKQRSHKSDQDNIQTSVVCLSASFENIDRPTEPIPTNVQVALPVQNTLAKQMTDQLVDRVHNVVPIITRSVTWNNFSKWSVRALSNLENGISSVVKKIQ